MLLSKNNNLCNIFFQFQDGDIPLFAAIKAGNFQITDELLKHESSSEQLRWKTKKLNDTALHLAVRSQDNDMVKQFIKFGAGIDVQNVMKFLSFFYFVFSKT